MKFWVPMFLYLPVLSVHSNGGRSGHPDDGCKRLCNGRGCGSDDTDEEPSCLRIHWQHDCGCSALDFCECCMGPPVDLGPIETTNQCLMPTCLNSYLTCSRLSENSCNCTIVTSNSTPPLDSFCSALCRPCAPPPPSTALGGVRTRPPPHKPICEICSRHCRNTEWSTTSKVSTSTEFTTLNGVTTSGVLTTLHEGKPSESSRSQTTIGIAVGVSVGVVLLAAAVLIVVCVVCRRRQTRPCCQQRDTESTDPYQAVDGQAKVPHTYETVVTAASPASRDQESPYNDGETTLVDNALYGGKTGKLPTSADGYEDVDAVHHSSAPVAPQRQPVYIDHDTTLVDNTLYGSETSAPTSNNPQNNVDYQDLTVIDNALYDRR